MTDSGFASAMSEYDEQWEHAQSNPRERTFSDKPELRSGKHQALVSRTSVFEQGDRWVFLIAYERPEGEIADFNNLDNEIGVSVAAEKAAMLGYAGPISGLEEACSSGTMLDQVCEINIKRKPGNERDFVNVYLNRCMGKAADPEEYRFNEEAAQQVAADSEQFVPSGDEDDIPF